jgi:hypothetical protein
MNGELVRVTWHDAHAVTDTWTNLHDLDTDPCIVATVGYLMGKVKSGHLCLAQSVILGDEPTLDNVIAIPYGMVKKIERLKPSGLLPVEAE